MYCNMQVVPGQYDNNYDVSCFNGGGSSPVCMGQGSS